MVFNSGNRLKWFYGWLLLVIVGAAAAVDAARPSAPAGRPLPEGDPPIDQMEPDESALSVVYLPLFLNKPLAPPFDMAQLMGGDGRLYEVQHSSGSQARHQTQTIGTTFFHTKGNEIKAEWEELWYTDQFIYRGTDTSPGSNQYYTLRDPGLYGSAWAPRTWEVGGLFERNPFVTFYWKDNCKPVSNKSGYQRSYLLFEAFYPAYTFPNGIQLANVAQLAWLETPNGEPIERYFYAPVFGLVGWWSKDRGMSYISEIHRPGARPSNTREVIGCLDRTALNVPPPSWQILPAWAWEYRR